MAHAIKIPEEVKQELLRRGVPEPRPSEAERNRSELSFQDRQQIGRPALYSGQVSLFRSRRTLMTGYELARRRYVFVDPPLAATAVTQRNRERGDPTFCLLIQERVQTPEDCPANERCRKLLQPLFKQPVFGALHFGAT